MGVVGCLVSTTQVGISTAAPLACFVLATSVTCVGFTRPPHNSLVVLLPIYAMNPSEKAKGKQRAVELPLDAVLPQTTVPEPQLDVTRELVIRFTEGILDLYIRVGQRDQVRDIKSSVSRI